LLDRYQEELDAAYRGEARHWVSVALQALLRDVPLPRESLAHLIAANRMDQQTTRYPTFADVLEYCTYSANPVGRLVLAVYGHDDATSIAFSDATCTALQLANFWQDVKRDWEIGRIYLPQDEMREYGVTERDLDAECASPALRRLMAFQVERARGYFADGLPLLDRVHGHLRVDLALFSCGGLAVLDRIESEDFDTLRERPALSGRDKVRIALTALRPGRWRRWI
jgi:squalene synthase HpnC